MPKSLYIVRNTGQFDIEIDGRAFRKGQATEPLELSDDEVVNLTAYCRLHAERVDEVGEVAVVTKGCKTEPAAVEVAPEPEPEAVDAEVLAALAELAQGTPTHCDLEPAVEPEGEAI